MNRKNLLELYHAAIWKTGFREDKKSKSWMPKLGPNDFRSVIRQGTYKGRGAVISVSPHENLMSRGRDFKRYKAAARDKKAIRIPEILRSGRISGAQFLIQEAAKGGGKRIVKNHPLATPEEKTEVAALYWTTVNSFPQFDFGGWSASDYFLQRLDKWFTIGRENNSDLITGTERDKTAQLIFSNARRLKIEPFFSHFGNTDIEKVDGKYFLWNAEIAPRPECFGIAMWIWNVMMYSWKREPAKIWNDMLHWVKIFGYEIPEPSGGVYTGDRNGAKVFINLLERVAATLLVDLPNKRSPYDKLGEKEIGQSRDNFRHILNSLLKFQF